MEFLLINHPLDCPICDQGGECQLQDLAVGYGASKSRYTEEKRVIYPKSFGPLISAREMNRCIQCTRCVRFGVEIAGVMELGMIDRGEHSEITTVAGDTVDSELSGNMIDVCPVGALTSKPFRYSARAWELSRRKSVSPHDSTGANLIVQVKGATRDARAAARERGRQRVLDRRPRPLLVRGAERARPPDRADDPPERRLADGRLDHRARVRRAQPDADLGGARRRRASARSARRSARVEELHLLAQAGARPRQRERRLPPAPRRLREHRRRRPHGRAGALARHVDRVAVGAAARARRRLVPAQGPPAVRAAHPPGRAQGLQGAQRARAARRLADADGREHRRRAERLGRRARRDRRGGRRGAGRRRAGAGRRRRRGARDRRVARERRAQGDPARQRGGAAPAGRRAARPRRLDRRAHRRERRLPRRGRQHGRRAARRRDARRRAASTPARCSAPSPARRR